MRQGRSEVHCHTRRTAWPRCRRRRSGPQGTARRYRRRRQRTYQQRILRSLDLMRRAPNRQGTARMPSRHGDHGPSDRGDRRCSRSPQPWRTCRPHMLCMRSTRPPRRFQRRRIRRGLRDPSPGPPCPRGIHHIHRRHPLPKRGRLHSPHKPSTEDSHDRTSQLHTLRTQPILPQRTFLRHTSYTRSSPRTSAARQSIRCMAYSDPSRDPLALPRRWCSWPSRLCPACPPRRRCSQPGRRSPPPRRIAPQRTLCSWLPPGRPACWRSRIGRWRRPPSTRSWGSCPSRSGPQRRRCTWRCFPRPSTCPRRTGRRRGSRCRTRC